MNNQRDVNHWHQQLLLGPNQSAVCFSSDLLLVYLWRFNISLFERAITMIIQLNGSAAAEQFSYLTNASGKLKKL